MKRLIEILIVLFVVALIVVPIIAVFLGGVAGPTCGQNGVCA